MTTWTSKPFCSYALHHCREYLATSRAYLFALFAGAAIGMAAWHWGNTPYIAIAFPILFPCMKGRAGVYAYAFGYHACTVYGLMSFASAWFNDSIGHFRGSCSLRWLLLSGLSLCLVIRAIQHGELRYRHPLLWWLVFCLHSRWC